MRRKAGMALALAAGMTVLLTSCPGTTAKEGSSQAEETASAETVETKTEENAVRETGTASEETETETEASTIQETEAASSGAGTEGKESIVQDAGTASAKAETEEREGSSVPATEAESAAAEAETGTVKKETKTETETETGTEAGSVEDEGKEKISSGESTHAAADQANDGKGETADTGETAFLVMIEESQAAAADWEENSLQPDSGTGGRQISSETGSLKENQDTETSAANDNAGGDSDSIKKDGPDNSGDGNISGGTITLPFVPVE